MTTEIIIMNRQAIALAADSATTVTHWVDGKEEKRYFKGANKIFELSSFRPVGAMIYGSASLQDIPWDVIAKAFRDHLGRKGFNDIPSYADELFAFLRDNSHLFPREYQSQLFIDEATKAFFSILFSASESRDMKEAGEDASAQQAVFRSCFESLRVELENETLPDIFRPETIDQAAAIHKPLLDEKIHSFVKDSPALNTEENLSLMSRLSIEMLFKRFDRFMDRSGFVIAGYGDNEYFPSYHEYSCFGVLLGDFLHRKESEGRISPDQPSYVKAFAQTDMVDTFLIGIGIDVYRHIAENNRQMLVDFAEQVCTLHSIEPKSGIDSLIQSIQRKYLDDLMNTMHRNHAWPFRRVVGALPIDEMASLAENLVKLQSLKEKVTKPTESVGGPIDVAVISKHDGFIWIERKHYFDPGLNSRYFRRQSDIFAQARHG